MKLRQRLIAEHKEFHRAEQHKRKLQENYEPWYAPGYGDPPSKTNPVTERELIDTHESLQAERMKKQVHETARLNRMDMGGNDIKDAARIRADFAAIVKNERGEYKRWFVTFMPDAVNSQKDMYHTRRNASWCAWPWVFEWDPDDKTLDTLDGLAALGGLDNQPAPWPEWKRARHRLDQWIVTNGPSRAALDAALERRRNKLRSDNAHIGPSADRTEAVRNG